jgi:hypothetical protein
MNDLDKVMIRIASAFFNFKIESLKEMIAMLEKSDEPQKQCFFRVYKEAQRAYVDGQNSALEILKNRADSIIESNNISKKIMEL